AATVELGPSGDGEHDSRLHRFDDPGGVQYVDDWLVGGPAADAEDAESPVAPPRNRMRFVRQCDLRDGIRCTDALATHCDHSLAELYIRDDDQVASAYQPGNDKGEVRRRDTRIVEIAHGFESSPRHPSLQQDDQDSQ